MFLTACDDTKRSDLFVDLRTDYVAGEEFLLAELILEPIEGEERWQEERVIGADESFVEGARLAEFKNLVAQPYRLVVKLRDRHGALTAERPAAFDVRNHRLVTIVITRDCSGVGCSDPGKPACLAGECVAEGCLPESPSACPPPRCESDGECPPPAVSCAQARCVEGRCLLAGRTPATCEPEKYCHPEKGCEPRSNVTSTDMDGGTCPTSCSSQGAECGTASDGCGGTQECGTCTMPEVCGGGGVGNLCADPGACVRDCDGTRCGASDGCGGTCVTDDGCCMDECDPRGLTRCSDGVREECANADTDECLEWGMPVTCPSGVCARADGCTPSGDCPAAPTTITLGPAASGFDACDLSSITDAFGVTGAFMTIADPGGTITIDDNEYAGCAMLDFGQRCTPSVICAGGVARETACGDDCEGGPCEPCGAFPASIDVLVSAHSPDRLDLFRRLMWRPLNITPGSSCSGYSNSTLRYMLVCLHPCAANGYSAQVNSVEIQNP